MNTDNAVELRDLTFAYTDESPRLVFDCAFKQGLITAVMGASGAGKSTMLSLIAGFEVPLSGKVFLQGDEHTQSAPDARPLSMVFQENNLFAHLSVFKNVGLGISPSLKLSDSDRDSIRQALKQVGLDDYSDRLPGQLSGGERQRVALARVLVRKRPILLLDEAFASLGPGLRNEMLDLVATLSKDNKLTTLMVTHSPEDALRIAQELVFIAEDGVVYAGPVGALSSASDEHVSIGNYLNG